MKRDGVGWDANPCSPTSGVSRVDELLVTRMAGSCRIESA